MPVARRRQTDLLYTCSKIRLTENVSANTNLNPSSNPNPKAQ